MFLDTKQFACYIIICLDLMIHLEPTVDLSANYYNQHVQLMLSLVF